MTLWKRLVVSIHFVVANKNRYKGIWWYLTYPYYVCIGAKAFWDVEKLMYRR